MHLRDTILKEHTKANCDRIVKWIGKSQERFDELVQLLVTDEYRVVQRAAWPLSYCVENHPSLIRKHFKTLLTQLHNPTVHIAVKRNVLRIFQDIEIPEIYHGELMDTCFRFIEAVNETAAVKAFSLTILGRLSEIYPEIKSEIRLIIEERWDEETPAFKARARAFLKDRK